MRNEGEEDFRSAYQISAFDVLAPRFTARPVIAWAKMDPDNNNIGHGIGILNCLVRREIDLFWLESF